MDATCVRFFWIERPCCAWSPGCRLGPTWDRSNPLKRGRFRGLGGRRSSSAEGGTLIRFRGRGQSWPLGGRGLPQPETVEGRRTGALQCCESALRTKANPGRSQLRERSIPDQRGKGTQAVVAAPCGTKLSWGHGTTRRRLTSRRRGYRRRNAFWSMAKLLGTAVAAGSLPSISRETYPV